MIKTTIIIILILLLLITLYSYYCLSSNMIEFEKTRLEFVLRKENEIKELESKIKVISNCNEKNEKYQQAIKSINSVIYELNLPPGSVCENPEYNNINGHIDINIGKNEIDIKKPGQNDIAIKVENENIMPKLSIHPVNSENEQHHVIMNKDILHEVPNNLIQHTNSEIKHTSISTGIDNEKSPFNFNDSIKNLIKPLTT